MHNFAKIKVPEEDGFVEATISKSNWHLLVDEETKFKRRKFFKTKGEIVTYIAEWMHGEKEHGHLVEALQLDYLGENVKVVKNARGSGSTRIVPVIFFRVQNKKVPSSTSLAGFTPVKLSPFLDTPSPHPFVL